MLAQVLPVGGGKRVESLIQVGIFRRQIVTIGQITSTGGGRCAESRIQVGVFRCRMVMARFKYRIVNIGQTLAAADAAQFLQLWTGGNILNIGIRHFDKCLHMTFVVDHVGQTSSVFDTPCVHDRKKHRSFAKIFGNQLEICGQVAFIKQNKKGGVVGIFASLRQIDSARTEYFKQYRSTGQDGPDLLVVTKGLQPLAHYCGKVVNDCHQPGVGSSFLLLFWRENSRLFRRVCD